MTENEIDLLAVSIRAGGRPTDELWQIRKAAIADRANESAMESLSDLWSLTFHVDGLFPKLEAAKAIVDVALAGDISYPISTNEGSIYDGLPLNERQQLFDYITERLGDERASVAGAALAEFADELMAGGPTA